MLYKNAKPVCWKNWKLKHSGNEAHVVVEVPLYSDAWIIGGPLKYGPYTIINSVPIHNHTNRYEWKASMILRAELFIESRSKDMSKTDEEHYHGGWLYDEIAALLALTHGIRIEAGPVQREFRIHGDPLGRARTYSPSLLPRVLPSVDAPVIPSLFLDCTLMDTELITKFSLLSQDNAIKLVKSARMYQKALYFSDASPELSWILFVSAIENAARDWASNDGDSLELLKNSHSELIDVLDEYDASGVLAAKIASLLAPRMKLTKKFINFCLDFLPNSPSERPQYNKVNFERDKIKKDLDKIYNYRSKALHAGIPFPDPMCYPPYKLENGIYTEKPDGLAVSTKDAVWMSDDLPMHLHTFEYITRGVLLNWWRSMLSDHRE